MHFLSRAVVALTKTGAEHRAISQSRESFAFRRCRGVRTAVRVQQDAPLYEQPESLQSELAAFAAS